VSTDIQTCYRHPGNRAGVRCQRCERPICPQCMNQASVGFHCPECARKGRQRVYTAASLVTRPFVTYALIAINVVVYVLDLGSTSDVQTGQQSLADRGVLFGPAVAAGDWWRPITAGFLHANIIHIGFNMFLLFQLGRLLEPALNRISFATLYFTALLGGSFLVLVLDPNEATLGASGAVFGLMGAAFVGLRSRGIDPFSTQIGSLIILNLVFTFAIPNISIGGHIGGLVAGAAAGWLLFEAAPQIDQGRQRGTGTGIVVATGLCALLGLGLFAGCLYVASNPF
jgi:membrane associated rhomboid family serine protease